MNSISIMREFNLFVIGWVELIVLYFKESRSIRKRINVNGRIDGILIKFIKYVRYAIILGVLCGENNSKRLIWLYIYLLSIKNNMPVYELLNDCFSELFYLLIFREREGKRSFENVQTLFRCLVANE